MGRPWGNFRWGILRTGGLLRFSQELHRFGGVGPEITRLPLHQAMKTRRPRSVGTGGMSIILLFSLYRLEYPRHGHYPSTGFSCGQTAALFGLTGWFTAFAMPCVPSTNPAT